MISLRTLILSIAAVVLIETGAAVLFPIVYDRMILVGIVRIFEAAAVTVIIERSGPGHAALGLSAETFLPGLRQGFMWSVLFGSGALFLMILFWVAGIDILPLIRAKLPESSYQRATFFLVGGFVAPCAEELFFRGVIYGFFRRWGVWAALAASTLLFATAHGPVSALPVTQMIGGCIFALVYEREKNLLAPVTIHCLGNAAIFSLSLLPGR